MIKLSIIIPTFNSEERLKNCLYSVLNQNYPALEIIIVDGGSSDKTIEIINSSTNRIYKWISEPDHGIYDAMNKGISLCSNDTDYILFLGSDDQLICDLKFIANYLVDKNCVYYGKVLINNSIELLGKEFTLFKLFRGNIPHQAIFYPYNILRSCKYELKYKIYADWVLNIKLWKNTKFEFLPVAISLFNIYGASFSKSDIYFYEDKYQIIQNQYSKTFSIVARIMDFFVSVKKMVKNEKVM
jgi:glycosyltransferase involved in cell wall biosynthesis